MSSKIRRTQFVKLRSTQVTWSVKHFAFRVAVVATLCNDNAHGSTLDLSKGIHCEVTIWQRVTDAGKEESEYYYGIYCLLSAFVTVLTITTDNKSLIKISSQYLIEFTSYPVS